MFKDRALQVFICLQVWMVCPRDAHSTRKMEHNSPSGDVCWRLENIIPHTKPWWKMPMSSLDTPWSVRKWVHYRWTMVSHNVQEISWLLTISYADGRLVSCKYSLQNVCLSTKKIRQLSVFHWLTGFDVFIWMYMGLKTTILSPVLCHTPVICWFTINIS